MPSSNDGGPYLAVTSDDHRAIVVIIVVTCVTWSVMVMGARLIWRLHQKSDFGLDDTVALLGTVSLPRSQMKWMRGKPDTIADAQRCTSRLDIERSWYRCR